MTSTPLRNIILTSSDEALAQTVAEYLQGNYGHSIVSLKGLASSMIGKHSVTVISSTVDFDSLNDLGWVVELDQYIPDTIENLGNRIFDDACDHFLGELTTDELLVCA